MIVIDASALIAIFESESDADRYKRALSEADEVRVSAVNLHEVGIVMRARHGPDALEAMWRFLDENQIEVAPFDETQVREALSAFERFGKGMNPRARLNLADCAAYALARSLRAPLLFKGDDFTHTDIAAAI